jgi:hypothetical protein
MITDFLGELGDALTVPGRRRRRILSEVEDHLLCMAAELHAGGMSAADAEREAVARFGAPVALGRELSAVDARRHTLRAGWLALPLGFCAAWIGLRGVVGLGASRPLALTGFVLAQVALVSGGLTGFRAWVVRRGGDPALLVLVRRGSALVVSCLLVVGLGAGLTAVRHGTGLTAPAVGLLVGGGAVLVVCAGTLWLAFASPASAALETDHDLLSELSPLLGAERMVRFERWIGLRRRPWRFAGAVSLAAGLALAAGHGMGEGGPPDLAHLPRAVLAGSILAGVETLSALCGFLVLGRCLGLRAARDHS